VVLHPDKAVIEQIQRIVSTWLEDMGLTLKPSKTHLTHTLIRCEEQTGFDFLGFHIQQFPKDPQWNTQYNGNETTSRSSQEALKKLSRNESGHLDLSLKPT
jgi:RNA-directed DNA polymerase